MSENMIDIDRIEEVAIRSSIQVYTMINQQENPSGFGSGFIIKYKDKHFFITVFHVIKDEVETFLETNLPPQDNKQCLQSIGGIYSFNLLKAHEGITTEGLEQLLTSPGEIIDIAFSEYFPDKMGPLLQREIDFGALKIAECGKIFLDEKNISIPDKDNVFSFFGNIKHDYEGANLKFSPKLVNELKFHKDFGDFYKFKLKKVINSKEEFEGCSGAPIIDSLGNVVAIVCKVATGTNLVYGFSISKCIQFIDYTIRIDEINKSNS
jgi:hypothetical protein